jgi:DNA-binding transcriptional regulator LsrR (DeoR family)
MMEESDSGRRLPQPARLEQAARAAWLYYIGGRTQDEVAAQLNISRQGAQRLVALALAEKLIKFRLDHPIEACMQLGQALAERFQLRYCEVVPRDDGPGGPLAGLAIAGARYLERWLANRAPLVLALSTGRTLRAIVAEVSPMDAPQHKLLSLCGTIAADGRANSVEPVVRLAERTGAQCYPMPTPVVAATVAERELMQSQRSFTTLRALLDEARCIMVGVGNVGWRSPMHASGYISDTELTELIEAGAVGEISGWSFTADGKLLRGCVNARVTGLPVTTRPGCVTVGVGAGPQKVQAMRAALHGGLLNAVITDEATAAAILADTAT